MIALLLAVGFVILLMFVAGSVLMGLVYLIAFVVLIIRAIVRAVRDSKASS